MNSNLKWRRRGRRVGAGHHGHRGRDHRPSSLRDIVFGFNDGSVSTLALLAGVVGGALTKNNGIIAGMSGVVSGAIAMALGAYISTKSEHEEHLAEIEHEREKVRKDPGAQRRKLKDILARKTPLTDMELGTFVDTVATDRDSMLHMLVTEDLGFSEDQPYNPYRDALVMGSSFVAGGLIPLLPFMLMPGVLPALIASALVTFASLFGIGVWKATFTLRSWASSGLEMVIVGLVATVIPFIAGDLLINRLLHAFFS